MQKIYKKINSRQVASTDATSEAENVKYVEFAPQEFVRRNIAPLYSNHRIDTDTVFLHWLSPPPPLRVDLQAQTEWSGPFFLPLMMQG